MIALPIVSELISLLSSVTSWPNSLCSCYKRSLTHTNWVTESLDPITITTWNPHRIACGEEN